MKYAHFLRQITAFQRPSVLQRLVSVAYQFDSAIFDYHDAIFRFVHKHSKKDRDYKL